MKLLCAEESGDIIQGVMDIVERALGASRESKYIEFKEFLPATLGGSHPRPRGP
jgi:hypothetical protein